MNVIAKLTPDRVTVTPGEQQSLQLELLNESGLVDHFLIHVRNIPQEWVTVPDASLEILTDAGRNRGTVTLIFNPPRESSSIAGAYSFEVVVSSVGQPHALPVIVPGRLQVEPFYGFTSDMQPTRLKDNSKRPQLTIANTGNTPQTYTITALDREEALNFILSPSTLALEPGQSATVPILLSPKIRPLFGSTQRYPFEVTVSDGRTDSPPKTHDGELTVNPLFSRRALSLLALLLALCGLGSFCTASQLIALYNRQQAEAAQQATAAFQAELTRTASADPDQDGLLTFEEERLGTDPLLEDTDGDSLSDRVEAKQLGTNPLAFDSDNDTLSDGVEAASACLSPNNRDTDGDTLLDNVDPDPCQPPTPVPPPPPPTG